MSSDDAWRWMVKGLGGIVGMVANHHGDPQAGMCPQQWLEDIEKHAGRLLEVAREQREKSCTPNAT